MFIEAAWNYQHHTGGIVIGSYENSYLSAKLLIRSTTNVSITFSKIRVVRYNGLLFLDLYKITPSSERASVNIIGPLVKDATGISSELGTVNTEVTIEV